MIPPLEKKTRYLPPGVHEATWDEFRKRFGTSNERRAQLIGMRAAMESLRAAGCRRVYIDGSFVTSKSSPGDYDACWEVEGVVGVLLDPVILAPATGPTLFGTLGQKAKYLGEWYPIRANGTAAERYHLDFFQTDRDGVEKGIVAIDLEAP